MRRRAPALVAYLIFVALLVRGGNVLAQIPPTVDLPIRNIPQETPVWCWAAVAQQIILWRTGQSPPQCVLVEAANNYAPGTCCIHSHPACLVTGDFAKVAWLIARFAGTYSRYAPPTNYVQLYQTLNAGRAVLLQVQSGMLSTHVVVLRGMSFLPTPNGFLQPVLHINDPLSFFTNPVPFQQLPPIWIDALVVP